MTRKIKRAKDFEIILTLKSDAFIRPPREAQRNWLLNRTLREWTDDLRALDSAASRFAAGGQHNLPNDMEHADLSDGQIMEDWQMPLMEAMAEIAARSGGDVLEVGFGRGVSASLIQQHGVRSHSIIECNPSIARRFESWRQSHADRDIHLVLGKWQDCIAKLGQFDSVFFHTYPLDEEESIELLAESVTFAGHFFPAAAARLAPGGTFTYLSNEIDSLSRAHQRLIFRHFESFRVHLVDLELPEDVRDAWWADSMAVIEVTK